MAIGEAASKIKRGQMPNKEDLQRIASAKPREGAVHEIPKEGLVEIGNAMDELRAANRKLVINNESPAEYFSRRQEELEQRELLELPPIRVALRRAPRPPFPEGFVAPELQSINKSLKNLTPLSIHIPESGSGLRNTIGDSFVPTFPETKRWRAIFHS